MFRPKSLFNRYIRSHFITSQHKLNKLWKPPRMPVGRLYANVVKDVSLCIVYGPIFPLAYLLTAVRLALSFWTNLFTITYFFGRPVTLTLTLTRLTLTLTLTLTRSSACPSR